MTKLFADDLMEDERSPLFLFEIPGLDGNFALFAPRWEPWKQLIYIAIIVQVLQVVCACFNYALIVSRRDSTEAYLAGWAVTIPIVLWLPFQMVEHFELRNLIIKSIPSNLMIAVLLRTVEAMYGTSPPLVEESLINYIEYYTAGARHLIDPKSNQRLRATNQQVATPLLRFLLYFHLNSLTLSILMHFNFTVFRNSPVVLDDFHFQVDLLHPAHLANVYMITVHNYFHLRLAFELLGFQEGLKGYVVEEPFKDPLFSSKSPRDFWGRRWNSVIHDSLKSGVFLPVQKFFPRWVAVMATFFMSGFIHDYVWALALYHHQSSRDPATGVCSDCYTATPFKLTLFFLWNGGVMLLEKQVGHRPPFTWIAKYLPLPVVSTLVLLSVLPVSHWFTGEWAVSGGYTDLAQNMWIIRKLS